MHVVDDAVAMREPTTMRLALLAAVAVFGMVLPAAAAPADKAATDISAQSRKRPPASITVRPLRRAYPYRLQHSFYPPPYEVEYPGPNGVRQCADQYVTENRPSGAVIVPRMRCWWVRG